MMADQIILLFCLTFCMILRLHLKLTSKIVLLLFCEIILVPKIAWACQFSHSFLCPELLAAARPDMQQPLLVLSCSVALPDTRNHQVCECLY